MVKHSRYFLNIIVKHKIVTIDFVIIDKEEKLILLKIYVYNTNLIASIMFHTPNANSNGDYTYKNKWYKD